MKGADENPVICRTLTEAFPPGPYRPSPPIRTCFPIPARDMGKTTQLGGQTAGEALIEQAIKIEIVGYGFSPNAV